MTVEARLGVRIILVVTPRLASSRQIRSAILAMRIVARPLVSSPRMARFAEPVRGFAILKRHVVGPLLRVPLTRLHQMVSMPLLSLYKLILTCSTIGQSCGSSLSCSSGQCTSRDLQCKTLMGSYTQGNDTYACSSSGCQISCASPEFGANVCYSMQQNFLDGTSCQGGGKCNNGVCSGSSVGKEITSWINKNKTLVISLACVIGGLIIIAILGCCLSSYRRRRRIRMRKNLAPPPPAYGDGMGWGAPPRGPPRGQPSMVGANGNGMNGSWENGRWMPTAPPPPVWQPSIRYA